MAEVQPVQTIRFDAATHTYWLGERRLESVTTVIKSLVPPFDRDRISARSATKKGVSQAEILEEWDRKGQIAREKGTNVHAYIEDVINGVQDDVLGSLNQKLPEMVAFDAAWVAIREKLKATVRKKEYIVWDAELGVAGRIDLLLDVELSGQKAACLLDWKTGKFEVNNIYERLYPPFSGFDSCELSIYSLQTSLYRVLLKSMGVETAEAYLIHLNGDGTYRAYRALDLRDRVAAWAKSRVEF